MYFEDVVARHVGYGVGRGVSERDRLVYKSDEATGSHPILSKCGVARKLWCCCGVPKFSFLDGGYAYALFE